MSSQSNGPANRTAAIALCLMVLAVAVGCIAAATAHAANYKMVLCAGNNGSNSFDTSARPPGAFDFSNYCGPAPDPAGNSAWLRINENQDGCCAAVNDYGSISWTVPPWVAILAGGGYTREPNAFNSGWRGRFWAEDFGGGGPYNILMQGSEVGNSGINSEPTSAFTAHLWPFTGYGYYRRFIFELTCMRPGGCDRSNYNAVDANSIVLVLDDVSPAQVNFADTGSPLMQGRWVKGAQNVSWESFDLGSGLRLERLRVDGADRDVLDRAAQCDIGFSQQNTEFARSFQPCPNYGPYSHTYALDTASLPDGARAVEVCAQDYAQYQGLDQTKGESCDRRTIHVDNTAPGAPLGLQVVSANPARYLDHFGAKFSLPPDPGSPIAKVHYDIVDAAGSVVVPEHVVSALNPTELPAITGAAQAGDDRLRVWLEDEVGFTGPKAVAQIPHDTTPPAAPQGISVAAPETSRAAEGFDVRWRNLTDSGSPIDAAHYQVLNGAGGIAVPTQTLTGENIEALQSIETPGDGGNFSLRLWLSDAEGNVGAPATVPLSYECVRSEVQGGLGLSAAFSTNSGPTQVVDQGAGATIEGVLGGTGGGPAGARLCVFGKVTTGGAREFLGIAVSGGGGRYRFAVAPGPSREFEVLYRPGQRQISATATLYTRVQPTFELRPKVVRNGHFAYFFGQIPGPDNDGVVVVLQAKQGDGWRAFGRYRTQADGHFILRHFFRRTRVASLYGLRAQVRETVGYPYLEGNSPERVLHVLPARAPRRPR